MKLSKEWTSKEVTCSGKDRKQQLSSLRKKMFDHRESAAHKAALKIVAESEKMSLEKGFLT
jgi:hypothetical protein